MLTAADLVRVVRGRRLCLELAQRGPAGGEVRRAMFGEAHRVHEERGDYARGSVAMLMTTSDHDAPAPVSRAPRSAPTLVEALSAVDAQPPTPAELLAALSDTVTSAMGWQPPHAEDVVLARAEIRATLLPMAEAIVRAPGAAWWSSPLDRGAQTDTRFVDAPVSTTKAGGAPPETPAERLRRWRDGVLRHERDVSRYRARHRGIRVGGMWWVTPATAGLDTTTRALGDAGSASLWLTEDELGWEAADLVPCTIDPTARVLEIAGPTDWARLVEACPLDVTASRRPDWYETVDPHDGGWLIPDWSAVARDYEGVHVSVLAWLTTSGQAVPAGPGATTTMAGWDPDATWWLADVVRPAGAGQRWVRDEDSWATS